MGGKNPMPLFSPVQKGFLGPFALACHFPFITCPKELGAGQKYLSSDVGRRGVLDEWGKRVKEKERRFGE